MKYLKVGDKVKVKLVRKNVYDKVNSKIGTIISVNEVMKFVYLVSLEKMNIALKTSEVEKIS